MFYIIDTTTNTVIAALESVDNYTLAPSYIVREADLGADVSLIVYDPTTDTLRQVTDEEYLEIVKQAKLTELKAIVQAEFSELGDAVADTVKAIKLIIKFLLTEDESTKLALKDFLELLLADFEQLYPDDYSRHCVATYASSLLTKLPLYYQAKLQVLSATTPEEVQAVTLEFE